MSEPRLFALFVRPKRFYPDPVRSFLEYLKAFRGPFEMRGFPLNLYTASEQLAAGGGAATVSPVLVRAHREQPVSIRITEEGPSHLFSVDLGPAHGAADLLAMPKLLDLLCAGSRMMDASCAALTLEPQPNAMTRLRINGPALQLQTPPFAMWIGAPLARMFPSLEGYTRHAEWDGASLLYRSAAEDVLVLRQAIRWLIASKTEPVEIVEATLRSSLAVPDWEVRASAMFAAVRLNVPVLGHEIRRLEFPESTREGLTREDRRTLLAFQKAALSLLKGDPPPPPGDENEDTREGMRAHLLRCAAGLPTSFHDDVFLFQHALTEPLPVDYPPPGPLPVGLDLTIDGGYRTAKQGIEFVWIPPIAHWLGGGATVRRVVPEAGFFVSKWPLRDQAEAYIAGTWEEACEWCRDGGEQDSMQFSLPTANEWEMAARGPDGRRFPWGNGFESGIIDHLSPWGMGAATGVVGQWTQDGWICGLPEDPRCSVRHAPSRAAAVRLRLK